MQILGHGAKKSKQIPEVNNRGKTAFNRKRG